MHNYIQNLRKLIGNRKFIHPGARIIVENEQGQILMIRRKDNGNWGLPAGGLEENETIQECIIREVKEETGLDILALQVIGIGSDPIIETIKYPNQDVVQYFNIEFYSNQFSGAIAVLDEEEILSAEFVAKEMIQSLPENEQHTFKSLAYFEEHGQIYFS